MKGESSIKIPDLNVDCANTQITLNQENLGSESTAMEWTDEKHSLYLKSMEASFVNDLYNSFNLFNYKIKNPLDPKFSRQTHPSNTSSGQFKVLQHGCWEKINFEKNKSQSIKSEEPDVLFKNPWIRHFRSSNLPENVAAAADLSSYDSAEFTDQNFIKEEETGEETSHTSRPKRIKIEKSIDPITNNDQVVPLTKFQNSQTLTNRGYIRK